MGITKHLGPGRDRHRDLTLAGASELRQGTPSFGGEGQVEQFRWWWSGGLDWTGEEPQESAAIGADEPGIMRPRLATNGNGAAPA